MSPLYDFNCHNCKTAFEIKLSLSEHSEKKDKLPCTKCGSILVQKVAPLRFKLEGGGWYEQDYGITQHEMNSNLEQEKYVEEAANSYMEKEKIKQKQG